MSINRKLITGKIDSLCGSHGKSMDVFLESRMCPPVGVTPTGGKASYKQWANYSAVEGKIL